MRRVGVEQDGVALGKRQRLVAPNRNLHHTLGHNPVLPRSRRMGLGHFPVQRRDPQFI